MFSSISFSYCPTFSTCYETLLLHPRGLKDINSPSLIGSKNYLDPWTSGLTHVILTIWHRIPVASLPQMLLMDLQSSKLQFSISKIETPPSRKPTQICPALLDRSLWVRVQRSATPRKQTGEEDSLHNLETDNDRLKHRSNHLLSPLSTQSSLIGSDFGELRGRKVERSRGNQCQ